ncbi:MAG: 4-hydroxythreonine-4-phosphate dehydrogenase PdxA [candidate division WOR-3 bacterium]|nr:4-hydroxythreonine-4-phosphate dehydrogenase PdxA [candidate division WOR-3 bacterium]
MNRIIMTAGDISGINLFLILKTLHKYPAIKFSITIQREILERGAEFFRLDIPDNIDCIKPDIEPRRFTPGSDIDYTKEYAALSLIKAVGMIKKEKHPLITMPLNKKNTSMYIDGFGGHTEYLGRCFDARESMILYSRRISVCPATTHIPIDDVIDTVNRDLLLRHLINIDSFFREYIGKRPRITAVCFNPHCSDNGLIAPHDKNLKSMLDDLDQYDIEGPVSSDTAFLPERMRRTDVYLCMYHDQALIPFKIYSFEDGINITAGLPFLRVSPDHRPAIDIVHRQDEINTLSLENCIEFIEKRALN